MSKAQALLTLKTQYYGIVRIDKDEISEYRIGKYRHQAILEKVTSIAT